jgi:hypothetical protein
MLVLAWWVVPVTGALLVGAIIYSWGRRPRFRRTFEEVEYFHRFLNTLKRHYTERARRRGRSSA